jgi:hypothetical protein
MAQVDHLPIYVDALDDQVGLIWVALGSTAMIPIDNPALAGCRTRPATCSGVAASA